MKWLNPTEILIDEELFNQLVDCRLRSGSKSEMITIVKNSSKYMNDISAIQIVKIFNDMDESNMSVVLLEGLTRNVIFI